MYRILTDGTIECDNAEEAVALRDAMLKEKAPAAAPPAPARPLGRDLKALRMGVGWAQKTLGDKVGLSQSEISLIELGSKPCSQELIDKVKLLVEGVPTHRRQNSPMMPKPALPPPRSAAPGSTFEEMLAADPTLQARVKRCHAIDDSEPQKIAVPVKIAGGW